MNKWLTRSVLAVIAVVLVMMPVRSHIPEAESVPGHSLLQSDDRMASPELTCGGWDDRPRKGDDGVRLSAARDRVTEEEVARWLNHLESAGQVTIRRGLKRMGRYQDDIDAALAARNLPSSLRYLPLVEAGYDHLAVSPAGVAGLWQLMPETARSFGLEVNTLVDQRFDEPAATEATLDYLAALHERFQCWFLALAAVGQAAERDPPERFDVVWIEGAASADVLAAARGISEDDIRTLNPHLRIGLTPASGSTRLRVPAGAGAAFLAHFARIPVGARSTLREHIVAPGETLTRIARWYDVSLDALRTVNPDVEPRRMQIGTVLVIPRGAGTVVSGYRIAANPTSNPSYTRVAGMALR